jgi:transcriptional regulator with XRE-family HTH domain
MMTDTARYSGIKMGQTIRTRGLRFDWVAAQLGVSKSAVSKWVNGHQTMDRAVALRASALLGVPFDLLFDSPKGDAEIPERITA